MTIKDLKMKLMDMDDSCTVNMQKPDGTRMDITGASQMGDHLTLFMDS